MRTTIARGAFVGLFVGVCALAHAADLPPRPAGNDGPPVIGAWFWSQAEQEPNGFRPFLDAVAECTPYTLLTTSCRGREVVDPVQHDQMDKAVRYARSRGLRVALEVDIRLARQAFRAAYPDELQEELVLRCVPFADSQPAEVTFTGVDTRDHMNGRLPDYVCLTTRLVRVYSFRRGADGIDPASVVDITGAGVSAVADGPRRLTVRVPHQPGREVCVIAAHTVLTPDVFAPHFLAFQRGIIRQYADLPLAGIMKDEWGFPPDHTGNPGHDRYWFSSAMAAAYAQVSGGGDLVRDALLMCVGENGRDRERRAAVNRYRELCRSRNAAIEDDFYRAAKETFGRNAFVVTHATWTPYPGVQEFRKNGLDWWQATRDIGQSDETTPYACRTSLAKRWGYPLWYNQFYATTVKPYLVELWADALSGGRLNVHPLYPRPDLKAGARDDELLRGGLMAGMTRLRTLDFVSQAPLNCPVAVVFGHACAMNWTLPTYNDVGLGVVSALARQGYPTDLLPSSLVADRALRLDDEGFVCLGPQRYRAVVLYHPQFCGADEAAFFARAVKGSSAVFLVGDWTMDAAAAPFDGVSRLGGGVRLCNDAFACADAVKGLLESLDEPRVTAWTGTVPCWGQPGTSMATPPTDGHSALTDGTYVRVAGSTDPAGDPIRETFRWQGHEVTVDAVGVVAIRFAKDGRVAAFAAGGLQRLETDSLKLELPERTDLAFRTGPDGRVRGLIQGSSAAMPLPPALRSLTADWQRLGVPSRP
jgi:hypothetical protein